MCRMAFRPMSRQGCGWKSNIVEMRYCVYGKVGWIHRNETNRGLLINRNHNQIS